MMKLILKSSFSELINYYKYIYFFTLMFSVIGSYIVNYIINGNYVLINKEFYNIVNFCLIIFMGVIGSSVSHFKFLYLGYSIKVLVYNQVIINIINTIIMSLSIAICTGIIHYFSIIMFINILLLFLVYTSFINIITMILFPNLMKNATNGIILLHFFPIFMAYSFDDLLESLIKSFNSFTYVALCLSIIILIVFFIKNYKLVKSSNFLNGNINDMVSNPGNTIIM